MGDRRHGVARMGYATWGARGTSYEPPHPFTSMGHHAALAFGCGNWGAGSLRRAGPGRVVGSTLQLVVAQIWECGPEDTEQRSSTGAFLVCR